MDILEVFEEAGYETSAYATTPEPDSAKNEARRVALAGFDLIVAAGGDGTINEVVNGIAGLEERPKMAVIPAGTTNDYARALHIPRSDVVSAAEVVLKNQTIKMDVGQANDTYFINIAGGGSLTELTYEVPSQLKTIFGYLAYLVKGAEKLPGIKPMNMRLTYDDDVFEGEANMFLVGITNSIGGFEQIAPDAHLDDGEFSLLIVKKASLTEMLHMVALMLNGGRHITHPKLIYTKTKYLKAEPSDDKQMMINLDGEYGGDAPMEFKNLKQHIEMYADVDSIPDSAVTGELLEVENAFIREVEELTDEDIDGDGEVYSSKK